MQLYLLTPPWPSGSIARKALLRFTELRYRLAVNQPAHITARLIPPADVALNDMVELIRDGEREMLGYVTEVSSDGMTVNVEAIGALGILGWRHVLYFAGTAGKSSFTNIAAESLIKTIAATNFGAQATTAQGRLAAGNVNWFVIEADAARGVVFASRGCSWRNVLDECVEIAEYAQADLAIEQVGNAVELRYIPRPATPTPSHIFSPSFGNVDSYELRRIAHEANRVITAGQGEGSDRQYAIASLAGARPLREHVKYATWDGAQLGEEAQAELAQREPRLEVRWRAAQTAGSRYWRDYRLGDYVRVQIEDYAATHRITAVSVALSDMREDVEIDTTA